MDRYAHYELDGNVASIAIDDGKVNAFSIAMLKALHEALDRAEQDERTPRRSCARVRRRCADCATRSPRS
ncbi:MAG TPA: hypothetical protein VH081_07210 [Solirubrobacteraceae bacterium]|jgi:enoyl-CoA hydratase/carnithine racemase|nr:hypothetical protein [Solirubrobacteraceae bacterium]